LVPASSAAATVDNARFGAAIRRDWILDILAIVLLLTRTLSGSLRPAHLPSNKRILVKSVVGKRRGSLLRQCGIYKRRKRQRDKSARNVKPGTHFTNKRD